MKEIYDATFEAEEKSLKKSLSEKDRNLLKKHKLTPGHFDKIGMEFETFEKMKQKEKEELMSKTKEEAKKWIKEEQKKKKMDKLKEMDLKT